MFRCIFDKCLNGDRHIVNFIENFKPIEKIIKADRVSGLHDVKLRRKMHSSVMPMTAFPNELLNIGLNTSNLICCETQMPLSMNECSKFFFLCCLSGIYHARDLPFTLSQDRTRGCIRHVLFSNIMQLISCSYSGFELSLFIIFFLSFCPFK